MGSLRQVVTRITVPLSHLSPLAMKHITIVLLLLNVLLVSTFPAGGEQEEQEVTNNEVTAVTAGTDTDTDTAEEEEEEDAGAGDLIKVGASALHGLLGLLGAKIDIFRSLLTNKGLHEHVGKTVELGLNVTRDLVGAKVGAIRSAAELVPQLIDGKAALLEASSKGSTNLVDQGSRLIGSVVKAANSTAPLVANIVQETVEQIPLATGFVSAYAEVNAEQAQKVARRFYGSLQCDLQCSELEDPDLLEECENQFCKEDENSVYYDDDYYYDQ